MSKKKTATDVQGTDEQKPKKSSELNAIKRFAGTIKALRTANLISQEMDEELTELKNNMIRRYIQGNENVVEH